MVMMTMISSHDWNWLVKNSFVWWWWFWWWWRWQWRWQPHISCYQFHPPTQWWWWWWKSEQEKSTKSLLGSQGLCSARSSAIALHHFLHVCWQWWRFWWHLHISCYQLHPPTHLMHPPAKAVKHILLTNKFSGGETLSEAFYVKRIYKEGQFWG